MTTDMTDSLLALYGRWMSLRGLSSNTREQRLGCIDRMTRATGLDPSAVTAAHLAAWQEGWRLSPQTHCTYVSHIQAFYAWAVQAGLMDEDPSSVLVRPRLPRRLPRPISEERLVVALDAAAGRVRAYLFLAAFAGLRACEMAGLAREDVRDDAERPYLVLTGKGSKERVVPMAPLLWSELRMLGMPDSGYVFGRRHDPARHVVPGTVSNQANDYLHGLGFRETLHTLRHRFATRFYQESLDIRMTQEMLGHSSPATTAGYAAYAPDKASAVVMRLTRVA